MQGEVHDRLMLPTAAPSNRSRYDGVARLLVEAHRPALGPLPARPVIAIIWLDEKVGREQDGLKI
jgi:hypothetical protein